MLSFLGLFLSLAMGQEFRIEEATIAEVHEAMRTGRLTCRALVDGYLDRKSVV